MFDVKYKLLTNKYAGKSEQEIKSIFDEKVEEYKKMMTVLQPATYGIDFLKGDFPLWVKLAHIDEFLDCPHCVAEYKEKLAKKEMEPCLLCGEPFPKNGNDVCPKCFEGEEVNKTIKSVTKH
jgi:hypothetical protein